MMDGYGVDGRMMGDGWMDQQKNEWMDRPMDGWMVRWTVNKKIFIFLSSFFGNRDKIIASLSRNTTFVLS